MHIRNSSIEDDASVTIDEKTDENKNFDINYYRYLLKQHSANDVEQIERVKKIFIYLTFSLFCDILNKKCFIIRRNLCFLTIQFIWFI